MIREFCAENTRFVAEAIDSGAGRIELCDALDVGGTSPKASVVEEVVKYAHSRGVKVMVMVRPRGGNFTYSSDEIAEMIDFIDIVRNKEADGVVFGALTPENRIDREATQSLLEASEGLSVTFHMAFDEVPWPQNLDDLAWLRDVGGVDRVLTHGGALSTPIMNNVDNLLKFVEIAGGRLTILPGGGVTYENADALQRLLGTCEMHGTKIVKI